MRAVNGEVKSERVKLRSECDEVKRGIRKEIRRQPQHGSDLFKPAQVLGATAAIMVMVSQKNCRVGFALPNAAATTENNTNVHRNSQCHQQSSSAAVVVNDRSPEQPNEITWKDEARRMSFQRQYSITSTSGDLTPKHHRLQHPSLAGSDGALKHLCKPAGKVLPRDRVTLPSSCLPEAQILTEPAETLHQRTRASPYHCRMCDIRDQLGQISKTRRMVQSGEKYRGLNSLGIPRSQQRMSGK